MLPVVKWKSKSTQKYTRDFYLNKCVYMYCSHCGVNYRPLSWRRGAYSIFIDVLYLSYDPDTFTISKCRETPRNIPVTMSYWVFLHSRDKISTCDFLLFLILYQVSRHIIIRCRRLEKQSKQNNHLTSSKDNLFEVTSQITIKTKQSIYFSLR